MRGSSKAHKIEPQIEAPERPRPLQPKRAPHGTASARALQLHLAARLTEQPKWSPRRSWAFIIGSSSVGWLGIGLLIRSVFKI